MVLSLAPTVDDPHDHVVTLYDDYADIHDDLARFLAEGLVAGDAVVILAVEDHRQALERALAEHADLDQARAEGRYVSIEASAALATFHVGGRIVPELFRRSIGSVLDDLGRGDRPIRAYGEMVAVLWDAGERWAAVDLEVLWNEIGQDHLLSLRCAYPMATLSRSGDLRAIHAVCAHHTDVGVPESYRTDDASSWLAADADRSELFIAHPLAIRAVRRFVVGALSDLEDEVVRGEAALVASELAANVVDHVGSPFRVTVRRSTETITIAVEDLSVDPPVRLDPAVAVGGRGLTIIEATCTRWGSDTGQTTKVVWAELSRR